MQTDVPADMQILRRHLGLPIHDLLRMLLHPSVVDVDDLSPCFIPVPAADIPFDADIPAAQAPPPAPAPVHIDIPVEHITPIHSPYEFHVGTSSSVPSRTDPQEASTSAPAEVDTQGEGLTQVEGLTQTEGSPRALPPRGGITYQRGRRQRGGRGRGDAGASQVTQDSLAAGRERRATAGQRRGCGT